MIYTSYFGKLRKIPKEIARVSVCKLAPKDYRGLQYKKLAPSLEMMLEYKNKQNRELYERRFTDEILSPLFITEVVSDLASLTDRAQDIVLVCYEKDENCCHRKFISDWLNKHSVSCEEWDESKHLSGYPIQMKMEI